MKHLRNIIIFVLLIGIAGVAAWQHIQLQRLTAQSAALQEQLTQALAKPEQPSMVRPTLAPGQRGEEAPSSELLRLRRQVAVLREQLASVVASNVATAAESPARAQITNSSSVATAEANLKKAEGEAELAEQKVSDLAAFLHLPQGASDEIAESSLSAADLGSYRQIKLDAQERQRFVQMLRLKVAASRALDGEPRTTK